MATPVTLKVYRGEELVRTERFTRDIIKIGRLSSAHLCLEDDRISRIHSVIEIAADGHISIIDMGSTEGTFVNGKRPEVLPAACLSRRIPRLATAASVVPAPRWQASKKQSMKRDLAKSHSPSGASFYFTA